MEWKRVVSTSMHTTVLRPFLIRILFSELGSMMTNYLLESSTWKSAVAQFNERFVPVEKEVATNLKELLLPVANNDPTAVNVIRVTRAFEEHTLNFL